MDVERRWENWKSKSRWQAYGHPHQEESKASYAWTKESFCQSSQHLYGWPKSEDWKGKDYHYGKQEVSEEYDLFGW